MSLTFNIRHLEKKDLHLKGDLPTHDLDLDLHDETIRPGPELSYDLEVQRLEGGALVQGTVRLPVEYICVRCLKKFKRPLVLDNWTVHLPLSGEDAVEISNDLVNLTPYLREDTLLALPQHPLCEVECRGLKLPARSKDPEPAKTASAWDELDKLKLKN
jgi:uncharacterized metal-binding protein YceD (DUF177 family)